MLRGDLRREVFVRKTSVVTACPIYTKLYKLFLYLEVMFFKSVISAICPFLFSASLLCNKHAQISGVQISYPTGAGDRRHLRGAGRRYKVKFPSSSHAITPQRVNVETRSFAHSYLNNWGIPWLFDIFFPKMYTLISPFSFKFGSWGYIGPWFQLWQWQY